EALAAECPHCRAPLRLNPFLVDHSHRWGVAASGASSTGPATSISGSSRREQLALRVLQAIGLAIVFSVIVFGMLCTIWWSWGWLIGVPLILVGMIILAQAVALATGMIGLAECPTCKGPAARIGKEMIFCPKCSGQSAGA